MPRARDDEAPWRWGLGDAVAGFLAAQVLAVVVAQLAWGTLLPVGTALGAGLAGLAEGEDLARSAGAPLLALVVAQVPLWSALVGAAVVAAQARGGGVVADLGLRFRIGDAPVGLAAGVATQAVVALGYWLWQQVAGDLDVDLPARQLAAKGEGAGAVALVLLLGVAGPFAEEVFYRGLVLRALERRIGPAPALVVSAGVFGLVHFQLVQLPGLALAGLAFGWLAQRTGRLGPAIWAHIGFNLTTLVLLM